jgi:2-keto-4-pentenoate hydratase/2-oxohepta-3-ene-1,7-dioic acid hydratase in catechol pathway
MEGKPLENFAPIGPYFGSADLVEHPNDLNLETRLKGQACQSTAMASLVNQTVRPPRWRKAAS